MDQSKSIIIELSGYLTRYSKVKLTSIFKKTLASQYQLIIFDISNIDYLDIEMIRLLIVFSHLLKDNNRKLIMINPNWKIKNMMNSTHLNDFFMLQEMQIESIYTEEAVTA